VGLKAKTPHQLAYQQIFSNALWFFEEGMKDFVDLVHTDFLLTVKTWKTKPVFQKTVKDARKAIKGQVSTDNDIYRYVSAGTKVRYATMSMDFAAKTRPGSISSGSGRGGVLFVNKKYPRPGIEARKFDKQIKDRRKGAFVLIMETRLVQIAEAMQ